MRRGFTAVGVLAGALLLSAGIYAQGKENPVGLILSAESAGIVHKNRPEMVAAAGDLLFPGDRIRAGKEAVSFILCPPENTPTRQSLAAGEATIERGGIVDRPKNLKDRGELPFCRLPQVEPEPEIGSKGVEDLAIRVADPAAYMQRVAGLAEAERNELAAVDEALRKNPGDMVAQTSRAALLERNGLAAEAADQYAAIAGAWKNQQWAKMLVQGNRTAAAPVRSGSGTTYAVVIGISKYANRAIPQLNYANADAWWFAQFLANERWPRAAPNKVTVRLLIDDKATLPAIQESIRFLANKAGKDDTVVFFFSGHGDVSGGEGYLIPTDADPENLPDSAFPMASLFTLMYDLSPQVGRFVMFVDACRAGIIGQITEKNAINQQIAKAVKDSKDNLEALLASQQTELAWEHKNFGDGHSAFSYFLLRGMAADGVREADFNGDGKVSLSELIRYVGDKVPDATRDKQHPTSFVKIQDLSAEDMADIGKPGLKIADWTPMPKEAFSRKALTPVSQSPVLAPTAQATEADLERLIRIQEQGQQIMLRYLEGDEIPQTRADFERGHQLYDEALTLAPGSLYLESRREFFLGRRLVFDKQYDDAITHLETAIRLNPRSPSPYNALGIALLELARYPESIAAFEGAISRAWYWPYPRHNLALAYMQQGRYEPAILAYRKAMQLAPAYSYLPYNLGLIYQKTNQRREAEDSYLEAKRLADLRASQSAQPELAEAYAERRAAPRIALALLEADDNHDVAARDYNDALTTLAAYPTNKNLLIARHDLALLLARRKENWTKAEELLAENMAAGYVPSQQRMAEWLVERGKPAQAVPYFEALLAAKPEYTAARLGLAEQLDKLSDTARERVQLELARQNDPGNVTVLLALARFESAQKQWRAAREAYRLALQHSDPKLSRQINGALKKLP